MDASEMDELPPDFQFGGYVVRQCIGRGGMARVYRAEHVALRKPVALKVMDVALLGHAAGAQRFLGEARAAAAVKHRNVVDIVDVGVWGKRPFMVMELLDGVDLERHLASNGPLSEAEIVALALPIIAGMTAVHDAGIIHRDLKPSNIFLTSVSDGEVTPKVLDFGISKLSEQLQEPGRRPTGTREVIGTPKYMAPEALDGVRELGPASDQYSLGVVLYECAVGKPPFGGESLLSLLRSIALGDFQPPRALRPELSVALEAVIVRAMRVSAEERFPTLRDLGRALWPLADERTRVIWARGFGDGRTTTLEKKDGTVDLALVRDRSRVVGSRSRKTAGALGALAALGAGAFWVWGGADGEVAEKNVAAPRAASAATDARSAPPTGAAASLAAAGSEAGDGAKAASAEPSEQSPDEASGADRHRARQTASRRAAERAREREPSKKARAALVRPSQSPPSAAELARAEPPRANRGDKDLAELFAPAPAPAAPRSEDELRGLFKSGDEAPLRSSNDAPIPD